MEGESGKNKLRLVTMTLCLQLPALGRERMCSALGTHYVPVFASGSFSYRLFIIPLKKATDIRMKG